MYANFDFYQNEYKGILITDSGEYDYFAERASDILAQYAARIGTDTEEKQVTFKKAQCRIADILFGDFKTSKFGASKIASESVNGYYNVAYGTQAHSEVVGQIAEAIRTYLGRWLYRGIPVVY